MGSTTKRWSYSAGERGRNRVRVYEEAKTGILYAEYYELDPGTGDRQRKRQSLGHRDRQKAKQQADEIAAKLGKLDAEQEAHSEVDERRSKAITLRELFDIYLDEVTPQKGDHKQAHDRRAAEMFLDFFGGGRKVETLNRRDWDRFIRARRDGQITAGDNSPEAGVGNRQITYDLKFLRAAFNWATAAGDASGQPLLSQNPCDGFPYPKQKSPKRPIISQERYEKMLTVADEIDWRFEVALVLAHETGHRIGAIRKLSWSDVDLDGNRVHWPADTDKIGSAHTTPVTDPAVTALRKARTHRPGIGAAWVLPAPTDNSKPCSRHLMRDWWLRAEELAELEHIDQMGWHSLRRKFATDLKGSVSLKDLCALGGWKDPQTILKCYQQADEETMRTALNDRANRLASGGT